MDEDEIRERISDIAARVIRMTAIAEGPDSPIGRLLDEPEEQGRGGGHPTLAERVRMLMEADERQRPAPAERGRQRENSAAE